MFISLIKLIDIEKRTKSLFLRKYLHRSEREGGRERERVAILESKHMITAAIDRSFRIHVNGR